MRWLIKCCYSKCQHRQTKASCSLETKQGDTQGRELEGSSLLERKESKPLLRSPQSSYSFSVMSSHCRETPGQCRGECLSPAFRSYHSVLRSLRNAYLSSAASSSYGKWWACTRAALTNSMAS